MKKKLGDVLVEAGLIDEVQLSVALGLQKQSGLKLGSQLLKLGFVQERELSAVLRKQLGIQLSLTERTIPSQAIQSVPMDLAFKYKVMPVAFDGKTILLAMTNPADLETVDALTFQLGKRIKPVHALEWEIDSALLRFYQDFSLDELDRLTSASRSADQYQKMTWNVGAETVLDRKSPPPQEESAPAGQRPPEEHGDVFPEDLIVRDADSWGPKKKAEPSAERKPASAPAAREETEEPPPAPPAREETEEPPPAPPAREVMEKPAPATETPEKPSSAPPTSGAPRRPVARKLSSLKKRATLQQALIELLVEKDIITERELLEKFMKLEREQPEE
jgi:hypothetical protein